jgi:hypothetical protein
MSDKGLKEYCSCYEKTLVSGDGIVTKKTSPKFLGKGVTLETVLERMLENRWLKCFKDNYVKLSDVTPTYTHTLSFPLLHKHYLSLSPSLPRSQSLCHTHTLSLYLYHSLCIYQPISLYYTHTLFIPL